MKLNPECLIDPTIKARLGFSGLESLTTDTNPTFVFYWDPFNNNNNNNKVEISVRFWGRKMENV